MIRDKWHGAILQALLEQRPIQVYDEDPDGTRTLNAVHPVWSVLTGLSDMPDTLRPEPRRSPWTTTNPV